MTIIRGTKKTNPCCLFARNSLRNKHKPFPVRVFDIAAEIREAHRGGQGEWGAGTSFWWRRFGFRQAPLGTEPGNSRYSSSGIIRIS